MTVYGFHASHEQVPPADLLAAVVRAELGFDAIYLHHVGREQSEFVDVFGEKVLPQLEVTRP